MSRDTVYLLDPTSRDVFGLTRLYSRLIEQVKAIKMNKAKAAQWLPTLLGLSQKGVKKAEIDSLMVPEFLAASGEEFVTKDQLLGHIARVMPRIKRIDLASPQYRGYRNMYSGNYSERLYTLTSEGMQADDEINQLMFEIDDLGFDPSPLMKDPGLVSRLEARLLLLRANRPKMHDFKSHHFNRNVKDYGKNLLAHARFSVVDDLFFVEEIQSDWAQGGRRTNWNSDFPQAPLVTETEQWSGLVLRDMMQSAAENPEVKNFAWIKSHMRNGFSIPEGGDSDSLSVFYDTIIRKLALKSIEKAGGRIVNMTVSTKNGPREVMSFEMTSQVREALRQPQPLYSMDRLRHPDSMPLTEGCMLLHELNGECAKMLGNAYSINLVARLFNIAEGKEVAGRIIKDTIEISRRALNPTRVARHEAWHFAQENFLFLHEREMIVACFGPGNMLNLKSRTMEAMRIAGMPQTAIDQCSDPRECAAHAFSLWCEGSLKIEEPRVDGIFARVMDAFMKVCNWVSEAIYGHKINTTEELFTALRSGALVARQRQMDSQAASDVERVNSMAPGV